VLARHTLIDVKAEKHVKHLEEIPGAESDAACVQIHRPANPLEASTALILALCDRFRAKQLADRGVRGNHVRGDGGRGGGSKDVVDVHLRKTRNAGSNQGEDTTGDDSKCVGHSSPTKHASEVEGYDIIGEQESKERDACRCKPQEIESALEILLPQSYILPSVTISGGQHHEHKSNQRGVGQGTPVANVVGVEISTFQTW
jgi:hypothetical protein